MKRCCLLLLSMLLMLTLCGCQSRSGEAGTVPLEEVPLADRFTTSASIRYEGFEMVAEVDRDRPGHYVIELMQPESLAGMQLDLSEEQVSITYKGITADFDPDSIAGSAIARGLVGTLNAIAAEQGISATLADGVFTLAGENEMGAFTLTLDAESGSLLALSVPERELEITFSNFLAHDA